MPFFNQLKKVTGSVKKAYIYSLPKEKALEFLNNIAEEEADHFHSLKDEKSPLFSQAKTLFGNFNSAAKVPGLFKASAKALLKAGGKIYLHQNPETKNVVDGIISWGCFVDAKGKKSILIDTLYAAVPKKGIGSRLVKYALTQAFAEGVEMLYWETGLGRQEAQKLYSERFKIDPYGVAFRYQPSKSQFLWNFGGTILWNAIF